MKKKQKALLASVVVASVVGVVLLFVPKKASLPVSQVTQTPPSNRETSNKIERDLVKIEEQIDASVLSREDIAAVKKEIIQAEKNNQLETATAKLEEYRQLIAKQQQSVVATESSRQPETTQQATTTHAETTAQSTNQVVDVPTTDTYKVIVNKKHPLPADYAPGENPVAKQAFLKLKEAMQQQGFAVSDSYSGFRSYQHQQQVYNNYVRQDGQANADKYSARPGHSEHQTGLAYDFIDTSGQLLGEGIRDGATDWLAANAHRYGFVVRYQHGKEHITGYMAETWHVRFIGNDATAVYQSGLTLEEYYGVSGGDYE